MELHGQIQLDFLGAGGTVTGSKFLLNAFGKLILVDCGMFQGLKSLRLQNWNDLPVYANDIDCVLLTHGHLDHTGYLPRLVGAEFKGQIIGTAPTLQITKIILEDSAKIQEEEAERANKEGYSKHHPALPLYNLKDVEQTVKLFVPKALSEWHSLTEQISYRFRYNGHIIGATFIELKVGNKLFVFSGDIGRQQDVLLYPPERPEEADVLLIESTYGNRLHEDSGAQKLAQAINESVAKGGTVIIPSFAVERAQSLMYLLWQLKKKKAIPNIPIYMDSPMGRNVLEVFHYNTSWHKLPADQCTEMCRDIIRIKEMKDTLAVAEDKQTKIIIAGSGMASGGRVLTYFKYYLGDPSATILLVGYQAEGTRGRQLLEGAEFIRLYGKNYLVDARIVNIPGLSAHADQTELLEWMQAIKKQPEQIFIVHGERESSEALKQKIKERYGWNAQLPQLFDSVKIDY